MPKNYTPTNVVDPDLGQGPTPLEYEIICMQVSGSIIKILSRSGFGSEPEKSI